MKIIKRIVFITFVIIIILCVGVFVGLNSKSLSQKIIPALLIQDSKDISVSNFNITDQSFDINGLLKLEGVSFTLNTKEDEFLVSLDSIQANFYRIYSQQNARIFIECKGIDVESEFINVINTQVNAQMLQDGSIYEGRFEGEKLKYLDYEFTHFAGDIFRENPVLMLYAVNADFYGGQIEMEILLENTAQLNYSVKTSLKSVDVKKLEKVNKSVFSSVKGLVSGDIDITGSEKEDYTLTGKIYSISDMEVKAVLMKPLLDHIPQSQQKKDLEVLFKEEGNIPLDVAEIMLLSVTDEQIQTRVEIESKKFNLDIGVNLDFNIEGGVKNALNLHKQFFLKKR